MFSTGLRLGFVAKALTPVENSLNGIKELQPFALASRVQEVCLSRVGDGSNDASIRGGPKNPITLAPARGPNER